MPFNEDHNDDNDSVEVDRNSIHEDDILEKPLTRGKSLYGIDG